MLDLKKACQFAEMLAIEVGQELLRHQSKAKIVYYKDAEDIQTTADLNAESFLISEIKKKYPDHSIYSEESGHDQVKSDYQWILDPLDGTKEYYRHIPQYNTCFVLEYKNNAVLSIVYRPSSSELFSATLGNGAYYNKEQVHYSQVKKINHSFIFAYLPTYKTAVSHAKTSWQILYRLSRKVYRLRGIAEESAALCWVGAGSIEACLNLGPQAKWHDIIPGLFFAQEAGAAISDIHGRTLIPHQLDSGFLVSNPFLHQEIIHLINQEVLP